MTFFENKRCSILWAILGIQLFIFRIALGSSENCRTSPLAQLNFPLIEAVDELNCRPMSFGQQKIVNIAGGRSPTTVEMHYVLRRKQAKTYEIGINPSFIAQLPFANWEITKTNSKRLAGAMRSRVEECIGLANRNFLGPEGESFQISLLDPSDSIAKDVEVPIQIICNNPKHRHSSRKYGEKIDCKTIVHEIMHLLGLVDEYEESDPNPDSITKKNFDCRNRSVATSIMSHHGEKIKESGDASSTQVIACISPEVQRRSPVPTSADSKCPPGFRIGTFSIKMNAFDWTELSDKMKKANIVDAVFRLSNTAEDYPADPEWIGRNIEILGQNTKFEESGNSLLRPAQFRSIVKPLCRSANEKFYKCAKMAYQTSSHFLGIPISCPTRLPDCQNDEWLK